MTGAEIATLRESLGLSAYDLALLLNVEERSVWHWEQGTAKPTGSARAVLDGIAEAVRHWPDSVAVIGQALGSASRVGGLAYLVVRFAESVARAATPESEKGEP